MTHYESAYRNHAACGEYMVELTSRLSLVTCIECWARIDDDREARIRITARKR